MSAPVEQPFANLGVLGTIVARNLDEIIDLPDYKTPFPGVYKLLVQHVKEDERKGKKCLVVGYKIAEVVQLNGTPDPEEDKDQIVSQGDMFNEVYYFDKAENLETVLGALKKKYAGLASAVGSVNLADILQKMPGMLVQCIIDNRASKHPDTGRLVLFPQTKEMVPAI